MISQGGTTTPLQSRASKISAAASSSGKVNAQTLSQIIGSLSKESGEGSSEGDKKRSIVEMSTILTRNNTQQVIYFKIFFKNIKIKVVDKYKEQLIPHLPDQGGLQNVNDELIQTVGNPQFQQSADFIGQALQMGQLGRALEHFHLNRPVIEAATKGDLTQFAEKLTTQEGFKYYLKLKKSFSVVDKTIEKEADDEQNIANELVKEEENEKKKKEESEKVKADKKPQRERDDDMELD